MGQYFKLINPVKGEYIDAWSMGTGAKAVEILGSHPSLATALMLLVTSHPEVRGGGDFDLGNEGSEYAAVARSVIGRWVGDRVMFIGDYAEQGDIPGFDAKALYRATTPKTRKTWVKARPRDPNISAWCETDPSSPRYGWFHYDKVIAPPAFTDISAMVREVIAHEEGATFDGSRWRYPGNEGGRSVLRPDMVVSIR